MLRPRPLVFFLLSLSVSFCYQPNLFADGHFGITQIVPDSIQSMSNVFPVSPRLGYEANSKKEQTNNISLEYSGSALWSQITDFEIKGHYAYCTMYNGLFIIDISNADNPTCISKLYIQESMSTAIKLFDHYAAIVGGKVPRGSLSIIDISDPAKPERVGFATLASTGADDIDVSGTTAYIGGSAGLLIADISSPSSPSFITLDTLFSARRIAIFNHYLYTTSNHFYILDISNPHNPTLVSQFDTPGEANDFAIDEGKSAYISAQSPFTPRTWSALVVLDINDPSVPTLKSTHTLLGSASCIAKSGNFVYMGNSTGLLIFDVSDTDTSLLVGSTPLPGYFSQIIIADTLAFISSEMQLVEPEFPLMCDSCSCRELNNPARTIGGDFMIVDVSDKTSPCLPQIFPSASTHLTAIATNEIYAFISDDFCDSIMIVDISKDDSLGKRGAISIPGELKAYAVNGNYLYVSYKDSGLNIYDITDPLHPEHLGKVSVPDGYSFRDP